MIRHHRGRQHQRHLRHRRRQHAQGLTQSLTYGPTSVALAVDPSAPIIVAPTNATIYTALGSSAILAAQQANSALLTHLAEMQIGSGSPQVATVLGTTTPTQTAFTGTASALDDLLPALPQAVGAMGGWFKGIGSFDNLTGSGGIPGFATQAGGFLMGLDRVLAQNLTGGIALGYLHTNVSEDTGSTSTIDTPRLSVYGSYTFGNLAIDATAGYGYDFYSANRPFPLLGQTASSSYNGQEATAALQASAKLNMGSVTLLPAIGMVYAHASQNSAGESGAPGFNLNVNSNSANSLRPFAAITAAKTFTTGDGTVLTPEADISYSYETLGTTPPSTVSVGGGTFVISGLLPQRNNLTIGGGVTAQLTDVLALEAAYHITPPTGNALAQTLSLGLDYRF